LFIDYTNKNSYSAALSLLIRGELMQYISTLTWQRDLSIPFNAKTYDRTHQIKFGGGSTINASSAAEFSGKAELPNPEELFTAAISSCFTLTLLYLAAVKGIIINDCQIEAVGTLAKNDEGKMAVVEVIIKPQLNFQDNQQPDDVLFKELLHKAHEQCFISSSVKTKVSIEYS
jgi:organic hydroperoxide reductase OsmC/OhrA